MTLWKASFVRICRLAVFSLGRELNILTITLAVLGGIQIAAVLLGAVDWLGKDPNAIWGITILVLVTLRTSRAFSDLDHDPAATEWILFPATPTEKYLAAQIGLGILYYGLAIAAASAVSALVGWLQTLVNGGPFHWLGELWFLTPPARIVPTVTPGGPIADIFWGMICVGASAIFGKHAVWKVLLTLFGAVVFWFAAMATVHWMAFADQMRFLVSNRDQAFRTIEFLINNWETPALNALINQWWFGVVVPAYFIVYGWARLREVEARNALQS